jgi:phosphatidylglycerophosphatase A
LHLLSLGFGTGLVPKLPGTAGTVVGVVLFLPLQYLPWQYYLAVTLVMFVAGIWLCGRTADRLGVHDHPAIVWDEIVGYLVTMCLAPPGWMWLLAGFILFRIFDIWKPWPIRWLDKQVRGGLGIMLDDLLAAVYAMICIQIIAYLL